MPATKSPRKPRVETKIMSAHGRRLRVAVREGDGSRPPLLLMNGFSTALEGLQPFVDALPESAGVIRFDVPGVGDSPSPTFPYRLWQMSRIVARMLDKLNAPQVDVLGVSWGGALAQQFALQERRHCRRLVLVSTAPGVFIPGGVSVAREMLSRRRFDDHEHARDVAPWIYGGKIRRGEADLQMAPHMRSDRLGALYQQLALVGWTSVPFARLIRQRTLILSGDDDPVIPEINARFMRRLLPNAELHTFHDGHLGLVTSADEIAPVVEEFLSRD